VRAEGAGFSDRLLGTLECCREVVSNVDLGFRAIRDEHTLLRTHEATQAPSRPYSRCVGYLAFIDSSDLGIAVN
jgi:hypothetical protein